MDILQTVMDSSSHAMFTMDRQGIVTHINQQAKERFGLFNHSLYSHPAGCLEPEDLVILATSAMGMDDGNLQADDLALLGIRDLRLRSGDMLAAVGVYQGRGIKPVYKRLRRGEAVGMRLDVVFQGIPVSIHIGDKEIAVAVRGKTYRIDYFDCIGQMVVLDHRTRRVKFWEEKGYSARKEGIGNLLRGAGFVAKGPDEEITVVGYHFREFFEGALFEEHLRQVLAGEAPSFSDLACEINGFALLASILPMKDSGRIEGVIVKFRNIEDIRTTILERNTAIAAAERKYQEASERALPDTAAIPLLTFGNSAASRTVRRQAYKFSQMDCNILIVGESGTGKSRLARWMLQTQSRGGRVIRVDCSAEDPAYLAEKLFGKKKELPGLFQEADGGTLVLEAVDRLPEKIQAKLLDTIQNREVIPVDASRPLPVDVRLLAVAGPGLREAAEAGRFRRDLYDRLAAFSVMLPPLRERREDIFFIANELVEQICRRYRIPDKALSGEALSKLTRYDWPGNLRELESVLERAAALSDSDIIYPEHLHLPTEITISTLRQHMQQEERRYIQQVLSQCGGDRRLAMEQLDLSRSVFYARLKEYGLK
ncbi:MAG: sigma 54-interacting transcriptional regulator [Clostridia bacterium]|nr:sigma 54-interacting transcriptional regulator [Clostridia bacterium]